MAPLSKVSDTTVPVAAEAAGIPGSAVVPAANTHARPASPARRNHRARAFPRQACGRTLSVAAFRAILLLDTNTAAAPHAPAGASGLMNPRPAVLPSSGTSSHGVMHAV